MSLTRYASVLGLGFGDCGKGRFIDFLARRWNAHTVVRFSGGAQAGHNVIDHTEAASSPRHHTFSQFGAGTFVPGTRTVLIDPMIVHPTALIVEAEALQRVGIDDALSRITIDGNCRVTTPFHQAAGCLRELLRGENAHGTCGVGVGETVAHSIGNPSQTFRYEDLLSPSAPEKLNAIRESLLNEFSPLIAEHPARRITEEFQTLLDESIAGKWLNISRTLARQCPPASSGEIGELLTQPGCVLFEGAQGILLDEDYGFHPHTTWSSITTSSVESAAARFGITDRIEHFGAIRTYLTRHGAGPFPTHDSALDSFPEPHNSAAGWQGQFRRGHPDAVLLEYALEAIGPLDGLLVSHADIFSREINLRWCDRYELPDSTTLDHLPVDPTKNLRHQEKLTDLLFNARPGYSGQPIPNFRAYLERLASVTSVPVSFHSHGPAAPDVTETRFSA